VLCSLKRLWDNWSTIYDSKEQEFVFSSHFFSSVAFDKYFSEAINKVQIYRIPQSTCMGAVECLCCAYMWNYHLRKYTKNFLIEIDIC